MRDVDASNVTASQAAVVRAVFFVDLDFASGRVRATDAPYDITFDSNTYRGVGDLGGIGAVSEDRDLSSPGLAIELSGIPTDLIDAVTDEEYHQRDAIIYAGFLDNETRALVADPLQIWAGRMDQMRIEIEEGLARIQLTLESRLAMVAPRRQIRNAETLRARFAGDTFFDYLDKLADLRLKWGSETVIAVGTGPNKPDAPPRALP